MNSFRKIFTVSAFVAVSTFASPASAALFIAAHPDDIEYLMNKNAANDVKGNYPTVFVLMTAGDAGVGTGLNGNTKGISYYRARLKAHELSVRLWQGLDPSVAPPLPTYSTSVIKGKNIETVKMGNVVMYNLNLPDNGSLPQLSASQIGSVNSISPVNTYTLAQLKDVIREIIRINNPATPMINLNTQDYDQGYNPGDHGDHLATGAIVNAAVTEVPAYNCVHRLFYKGYAVGGHAVTYSQDELNIHVATIGVMNSGLLDNGNKSTWDSFHNNFFGKLDWRGAAGTGNCAF